MIGVALTAVVVAVVVIGSLVFDLGPKPVPSSNASVASEPRVEADERP